MPVTSKKSDLFRNELLNGDVIDNSKVRGRVRVATGIMANAADDLNTSKFLLAKVPSHALLHTDCAFDVENWGFAAIRIGTESDVDALVSVAKSAGTSVTPVVFGDAKHGLELWQVLGLSADPRGEIGIWAHAIADATGAGNMPFRISWIEN